MKWERLIQSHFDVVGTSGDEFICRCPWHQDGNKPNLYVNGVKGLYLCHSCNAKGHLSALEDDLPPLDTSDVRNLLKALQKPAEAARTYPESWLAQFTPYHEEWDRRGLSKFIQEKFDLGYDPITNALTIPVRNRYGKLTGVVRRTLEKSKSIPRYHYPRGFRNSETVFGLWLVKQRHTKIAVVEGAIDAISCWDARVPAVAIMGSRIHDGQVEQLARHGVRHVVLMLDNDPAGHGRRKPKPTGKWQVYEALASVGIVVTFGVWRSYWTAKDPNDLTAQQRKKMFHSSLPWSAYIDKMEAGSLY